MSTVLAVSVVAVFTAVCGILLQRSNKEIALLFSAAAVVLIFLYLLPQVEVLTEAVQVLSENEALTEVLSVLVKALGIVLTARIAAQLCKDAGENALASGVDFAAKIAELLLTLPLLQQFMDMIRDVLAL